MNIQFKRFNHRRRAISTMELIVFPLVILGLANLYSSTNIQPDQFPNTFGQNSTQSYFGSGATSSSQLEAQACAQVSGTPLFSLSHCPTASGTFNFNPSNNSSLIFIGILTAVIALAVVSGVQVISSGINGGAVLVLAIGTALILLWMSLSAGGLPTFLTMPQPFGNLLYTICSLSYTIGGIGLLGRAGDTE